jgi:hypothetical protein
LGITPNEFRYGADDVQKDEHRYNEQPLLKDGVNADGQDTSNEDENSLCFIGLDSSGTEFEREHFYVRHH